MSNLEAVASLIGFIGNETVAVYRTRTRKAINSAALVADGLVSVDGRNRYSITENGVETLREGAAE